MIDRVSNTATEGWDDTKIRAERFQRIGSSNVPALCGLKASVELANQIGMDRIEKRHRKMADYILGQMQELGAQSRTSPDPALRCAVATVTIEPYKMPDPEIWMWKEKKIRIRGGLPSKLRLSTPYYLRKKDIERFLEACNEYRETHPA